MALIIAVSLTESTFKENYPHINKFILPHSPAEEKMSGIIIREFVEKYKGHKIVVFADQEKDKLVNLLILKDECNKAGVELSIVLYCKDKDPHSKHFNEWYFHNVDISLSEELADMQIW